MTPTFTYTEQILLDQSTGRCDGSLGEGASVPPFHVVARMLSSLKIVQLPKLVYVLPLA